MNAVTWHGKLGMGALTPAYPDNPPATRSGPAGTGKPTDMIRTFGVEEEFLLVNPDSGIPVDAEGKVLARAEGLPRNAPDAAVDRTLEAP